MATLSRDKYVRIRNHNKNFEVNAEEFIQLLELQYKTDIKNLPQWKELINLIHKSLTDYKTKLQNAENRKATIMQKLFIQYYRLSPFELTDYLIRTANVWQKLKQDSISAKISSTENIIPLHVESIISIVSDEEISSTIAHPNTEVIQSKEQMDLNQKLDYEMKSNSSSHLPTMVFTNQHRIISPLKSQCSILNYKNSTRVADDLSKSSIDDDIILIKETDSLKCYPNILLITDDSSQKQTIKFTVKNCVTEYLYVQFKNISDSSYFKSIKVVPATPIKLNPGLTITYKCIFILKENVEELSITSILYFRARRNVLTSSEEEALRIPILSKFQGMESVIVTDTICIPPIYPWQVKAPFKYPKGVLLIHVKSNKTYNLYIRTKGVDFAEQYNDDVDSLKAENSVTDSQQELENIDNSELLKSKILSSPKVTDTFIDTIDEIQAVVDNVTLILDDIVSRALQPFIFKNTYLRLMPKSKRINIVYFTKSEHIGYHQCYFDLIFTRPDNNDIVFVKTVKVFAEILPHPIVIVPNILDMTKSPVIFGYCKGNFTIRNINRTLPVTIKIKTTAKMKELFKVTPEKLLICPKSKAVFEIRMCVNHDIDLNCLEEYAYFTLEICFAENNSIYGNAPQLFYEVIAPCDTNFTKILARKRKISNRI